MANIIQQQDLLKGLPDNRLAMLLQNPVGDIPPFLVAAEAQRRQAIRQQFASNGPQESVVDSLTKQLANVPQNLNAPTQTPPMVPPTPPMQGVMALQQQQQMEQAAQNVQQPQMMRAGGMVQRYDIGGRVAPTVESLSEPTTLEEILYGLKAGAGRVADRIVDPFGVFNIANRYFPDQVTTYSEYFGADPASIEADKKKAAAEKIGEYNTMNRLDEEAALRRMAAPQAGTTAEERAEQNRLKQQYQQYADSRAAGTEEPEPGETEDEFRARIEALYAANEPSDWEKSQRWFSMAEQFLDPRKTTMQSVAGAGRAFAEQSAAMSAAERQAQREQERALLEYDIGERNRVAEAEQRRAEREYDSALKREERRTVTADATMRALTSQIENLTKAQIDIDEKMFGASDEEKASAKQAIQVQIDGYKAMMAQLAKQSGYNFGDVVTEDELRKMISGN
jgi:hypothetical protein